MTEIKESIFTISRDLFALYGFAGVSISDIATKAGIAKSTVLHHFPSKQRLYQEVVKQTIDDFSDFQTSRERSAKENIRTNLLLFFRWLIERPIHAKLLNRVFMDNPKAASYSAKKYWLPLLNNLLGDSARDEKMRVFALLIVNSIFQITFSIELQVLILKQPASKKSLINQYEKLIDELTRAQLSDKD